MGIVKGMAGTPPEIKTRIYADGNGVYVNDTKSGYKPFISFEYPDEQKWTDLAALYQRNAERQIIAHGGTITADGYQIMPQTIVAPPVVLIQNYDFESGDLTNWLARTAATDDPTKPHVYAQPNGPPSLIDNMAHSGDYKGVIHTDKSIRAATLSITIDGLSPGTTYCARAYVQSDTIARFFVEVSQTTTLDTDVVNTTLNTGREWVERGLTFTATTESIVLGLAIDAGNSGTAAIDDVTLEPILAIDSHSYLVSNATLTNATLATTRDGKSYITAMDKQGNAADFAIEVGQSGEYWMTIDYANGGDMFAQLKLIIDDQQYAYITFPQTARYGSFTQNTVEIPVKLAAGSHTIRLEKGIGDDKVELRSLIIASISTP